MNLPLRQELYDQLAREDAHFSRAPQAFFEAWKRGAEIAGAEWFGDGTREGLQRAKSKWDLRPNLLLLNDDDLTFAKIRLDERSLETLMTSVGDLAESLPRALCWSAAWDMTRDAEMRATDFVALILRGIGTETDITAVHRHDLLGGLGLRNCSGGGGGDGFRSLFSLQSCSGGCSGFCDLLLFLFEELSLALLLGSISSSGTAACCGGAQGRGNDRREGRRRR